MRRGAGAFYVLGPVNVWLDESNNRHYRAILRLPASHKAAITTAVLAFYNACLNSPK